MTEEHFEKQEPVSVWAYLVKQSNFWFVSVHLVLLVGVFGIGVMFMPADAPISSMIYGGVALLIFGLLILCISMYVLAIDFVRRKVMRKIAHEVGGTATFNLSLGEAELGHEFCIDKKSFEFEVVTYMALHPNAAILDYREVRPAHWILQTLLLWRVPSPEVRSHWTLVVLGEHSTQFQSQFPELSEHIQINEKHVYFRPSAWPLSSRLLPSARVLEIAKALQRSSSA